MDTMDFGVLHARVEYVCSISALVLLSFLPVFSACVLSAVKPGITSYDWIFRDISGHQPLPRPELVGGMMPDTRTTRALRHQPHRRALFDRRPVQNVQPHGQEGPTSG